MKRLSCLLLAIILPLFLFGCGQTEPKEAVTIEAATQATITELVEPIVEVVPIEKVSMIRSGHSFSWTAPRTPGAFMVDYLRPQILEIFDALGVEHEGEFHIQEGEAKSAGWLIIDNVYHRAIKRAYSISPDTWNSLTLLCFMIPEAETTRIFVQSVHEHSQAGLDSFYFADFTGDGTKDVFTISHHGYASYMAMTVGVFTFSEEGWGDPLFWSGPWEGIMPYDYG